MAYPYLLYIVVADINSPELNNAFQCNGIFMLLLIIVHKNTFKIQILKNVLTLSTECKTFK